jgi:ubiquinol-cytochrome c reductase iron-sulfur subunit
MNAIGRALMRLLAFASKALALLVALAGAVRPRRRTRIVAEGDPAPRGELAVILLLVGVAACAVMFVVIYAADWGHQTQLLGLALGSAFALLALALVIAGRTLVVEEELEEDYPEAGHPDEQGKVIQIVEESGSRITRKRFLWGAASAAGAALSVALAVPAISLGPVFDTESLYYSPWRRGLRLVDDEGRPYAASDLSSETFYTAYPEGVNHEEIAAPVVVVRISPSRLDLPPGRSDWAPQGILAYSKICTHAACAISLYRKPLFAPTSPSPALVCPCHYSTFDPASGGTVIFGPAGRDLPQLPLSIDGSGGLRAAGDFSGPVGPSFWGVRSGGPT